MTENSSGLGAEDVAELIERLERAVVRLEENQAKHSSFKLNSEYIRLGGKIDGVKLALSYLK